MQFALNHFWGGAGLTWSLPHSYHSISYRPHRRRNPPSLQWCSREKRFAQRRRYRFSLLQISAEKNARPQSLNLILIICVQHFDIKEMLLKNAKIREKGRTTAFRFRNAACNAQCRCIVVISKALLQNVHLDSVTASTLVNHWKGE